MIAPATPPAPSAAPTERLSLSEYNEREVVLRPDQVRALLAVGRNRFELHPTGDAQTFRLRATQHVGTVTVPGLQILIRPKVPLANLFYMLAVPGPKETWQETDFGYGVERQLLPAFATLFARAVDRALGRGPLRAYRLEHQRLSALRGRIDMAVQVRQPAIVTPLPCRYEDFTADVMENRALRAAIRRFLRLAGVPDRVRGILLHQLARLEDVADELVSPDAVDRVPITRLNRHYAPALGLASIVLRDTTLLTDVGRADASALLIDMNRVFEAFVADRLRRALQPALRVRDQRPGYLDNERLVSMRPDLVFEQDGRPVLVADTKYKLTDDGRGRVGDYFQLLAYTTAMGLRAGLLIYCHSGSGTPPRAITVRRGGQRLWTQAVRVGGTRAELEEAMVQLADLVRVLTRTDRQLA